MKFDDKKKDFMIKFMSKIMMDVHKHFKKNNEMTKKDFAKIEKVASKELKAEGKKLIGK